MKWEQSIRPKVQLSSEIQPDEKLHFRLAQTPLHFPKNRTQVADTKAQGEQLSSRTKALEQQDAALAYPTAAAPPCASACPGAAAGGRDPAPRSAYGQVNSQSTAGEHRTRAQPPSAVIRGQSTFWYQHSSVTLCCDHSSVTLWHSHHLSK